MESGVVEEHSHRISPKKSSAGMFDDYQKIGIIITGAGVIFTLLGVLTFFNRGFMTIGNLFFLTGVVLIIGFQKAFQFFIQKEKRKGSICFFIGILLVLFGRTFIGLIIEAFGVLNLFGDFFPVVIGFLRRLPIIGRILMLPFVKPFVEKLMNVDDSALPL